MLERETRAVATGRAHPQQIYALVCSRDATLRAVFGVEGKEKENASPWLGRRQTGERAHERLVSADRLPLWLVTGLSFFLLHPSLTSPEGKNKNERVVTEALGHVSRGVQACACHAGCEWAALINTPSNTG